MADDRRPGSPAPEVGPGNPPERMDVPLSSVAIQRIIEEIKADKTEKLTGYNRVYHRHNR
jgi:hypothetical protein